VFTPASLVSPLAPIASVAAAAAAEPAASGATKWMLLLALFVGGSLIVMAWARWVRTMHLALGFAATATLWALGYLALMQPGQALGEVLFALMLGVLFVAGFIGGRFGGPEVRPISIGIVSAIANLLVLGAFLRDEQHGSKVTPALYVIGLFAASAGLAWIGGVMGRRAADARRLPPATALFSLVAASTVFLLLITGGLVTSMESGLAVPDWPNSFGHNMLLYPVSEMKGGIFYEHAHRLYGMLVGTTSLVLVVVVWRSERQGWLRALAVVTLLAVCFQGYLGGTRVTGDLTLSQDRAFLAPSIVRAIFHGVFGQLVFTAFLLIAAATSRTWTETTAMVESPDAQTDRGVAQLLPWAFFLQLVLGALYRHLQPAGGVTAPGHPMWAILAHITMAVVVAGLVGVAAGRAWGHAYHPILRRLGLALLIGVGVQICFGIVAVAAVWTRVGAAIPAWEAITVTTHQITGALLFGGSILLAAWSRRLIPSSESQRILPQTA
jgi:cytochrome c oxidase assembly protein subunit 15